MVKCYCIKGCGNKKRKDKMFRVGTASSVSLHFLNSLTKTFPSDPTLYSPLMKNSSVKCR